MRSEEYKALVDQAIAEDQARDERLAALEEAVADITDILMGLPNTLTDMHKTDKLLWGHVKGIRKEIRGLQKA